MQTVPTRDPEDGPNHLKTALSGQSPCDTSELVRRGQTVEDVNLLVRIADSLGVPRSAWWEDAHPTNEVDPAANALGVDPDATQSAASDSST